MSGPALVAAIANTVDDADLGVVGATQQMMTQFGVVIGIQVMQATQAARESAVGEEQAFHDAYLVGAAAAFIGLVFAFFVARRVRTAEDLVLDPADLPTCYSVISEILAAASSWTASGAAVCMAIILVMSPRP